MLAKSLPWSAALKAGIGAHVATSMVISLLLATFWAGQTSFPGHQHPLGTPEHHHSLFQVIGAPSEPTPVTTVPKPVLVELTALSRGPRWFRAARARSAVQARAPPGYRARMAGDHPQPSHRSTR